MGRYLHPSDQGERLRRVLEIVPAGPPTPIPRTPKQVHRRLPADQVDQLINRYLAGATLKQLGQQFHIHRLTVAGLLEQRGVSRRYGSLAVDQITEAVKLYQSGLALAAVGEVLHVNATTVWHALQRRGIPLRDCQGREQG
jgi:hypothetical protein